MIVNPITVSPKATSAEAIRLLQVKKLPALPVVDEAGKLVGIVAKGDLLEVSPAARPRIDTISSLWSTMQIAAAMTKQVITVGENCPLEEAARILVDNKIGSLPVMRGDQVVGLVTRIEILRIMMDAMGGRSEGLRITIRLSEDKGELGAITDGIIQMGGRLTNLSTFWGGEPFNRIVTLKVQGMKREDLLLMLVRTIGVEVINFCEGGAETNQTTPLWSTAHAETFPIETVDSIIPWPLEPK
jgi:acetoin utilization protein AcuB